MKAPNPKNEQHTLVTVFEDFATAKEVVELLHKSGYGNDKMELVVHDVHAEAPDVETPKVHETTQSSLIENSEKWAAAGMGVGATAGIVAAVFAPFPGLIIGGIIAGGLTGAFIGGIAGVEHAVLDDSVDLPTLDEYQDMLESGHCMVVVLGTHDEIEPAKTIMKQAHHVGSHIHPLHGHAFHEHPAHLQNRQTITENKSKSKTTKE